MKPCYGQCDKCIWSKTINGCNPKGYEKKYKFDLDVFLRICKENGATVTEGKGRILMDGQPINLVEEVEKVLMKDFAPSVYQQIAT